MTSEEIEEVEEEVEEVEEEGKEGKEEKPASRFLDKKKSKDTGHFLDVVPKEYRDKDLDAKYKNPLEFYLGMKSLQKMVGADKIAIPNKDDTDEERVAAHHRLSGNSKFEDFEMSESDEFDEDSVESFREAAYKNGLSTTQANNMLSAVAKINDGVHELDSEDHEQQMLDWESENLDQFGGEVTEARASITRAVSHLGTDYLEAMGDDVYNPQTQKLLRAYGDTLAEGSVGEGGSFFAGSDIKGLSKEIDSLRDSLMGASRDDQFKIDKKLRTKVKQLNNMRRSR